MKQEGRATPEAGGGGVGRSCSKGGHGERDVYPEWVLWVLPAVCRSFWCGQPLGVACVTNGEVKAPYLWIAVKEG